MYTVPAAQGLKSFHCGDGNIRQNLTYKVNLRTEKIKIFIVCSHRPNTGMQMSQKTNIFMMISN